VYSNFLADISPTAITLFWFFVLLTIGGLIAYLWVTLWLQKRTGKMSPYTGLPLRPGYELPYESAKQILQYLYDRHEYDNRIFDLQTAAFCRETGRLFPNSITWLETIYVDWTFLQKRFPGHFVSWGSLTDTQQQDLIVAHGSLDGFQTAFSSFNSSPRMIEPEFAYAKPGPLYVDLESKIVMGWQEVPNTDFEVLIVKRPLQRHYSKIS
jgi:hypothetical protein